MIPISMNKSTQKKEMQLSSNCGTQGFRFCYDMYPTWLHHYSSICQVHHFLQDYWAGDEIWKPPTVLEIPSKKPAVLLSFVAAWTDVLSLGIHKLLKKQVSINSITYSHIYIPWDFCWGLKFTNMNNNTCPTDCNSIIFMSFCASEDSQRLEKPFYPRVI